MCEAFRLGHGGYVRRHVKKANVYKEALWAITHNE